MRSYVSKLFACLVLTLLCTAILPSAAQARPVIKFQIEHVYIHHAGEVEIVGYFENSGNQGAYPKRRKTPNFSYGDIRRVHRIYVSN